MTLFINNDVVSQVLTMKDTIEVLGKAYADLVAKEAVCRPRVDIQIPTSDPHKAYQWGSMEGGSVGGYFAIRMKSDIIYETEYNGAITQEKYCTQPGLFCGLGHCDHHLGGESYVHGYQSKLHCNLLGTV